MRNKNEKVFLIISAMILIIAYIGLVWFINAKIDCLINSDDSSDLILGHILASENSILTKSWYYSTELRVLNMQLFYAVFSKIFSVWHDVRVASYICLYAILILSYYITCHFLRFKRYFFITAVLLVLPFSEEYFEFVLKGAYYILYISTTFVTLGLCEGFVSTKSKLKSKIILVATLALAIIAGMGGARQIIVLYIPLVIAALCIFAMGGVSATNEKIALKLKPCDKRYMLFAIASFVGAFIGYVINSKYLAKIYYFKSWEKISFKGFDIASLSQIINGFFVSSGYVQGHVFSLASFKNFIAICWILMIFFVCFYFLKSKDNQSAYYRLSLFTVAAFGTFTILYIFTDIQYSNRYNLPIIILSLPLIAAFFESIKLPLKLKCITITAVVFVIACPALLLYQNKYYTDDTKELRTIVETLLEDDYTKGYTTFWRADILTDLSNGAIEVWDWQSSGSKEEITVSDIDTMYKWLQPVSHSYTHPEGKLFLLFTSKEWENNPWVGKLSTEHIIYRSDEYIVIGYDSYAKLKEDTADK